MYRPNPKYGMIDQPMAYAQQHPIRMQAFSIILTFQIILRSLSDQFLYRDLLDVILVPLIPLTMTL
jgi:hypothetical protein